MFLIFFLISFASINFHQERKKYIFTPFGPTIEPYRSKQCFIDKHPVLMCIKPWSRTMPLLIGGCSSEGLLLYKGKFKFGDDCRHDMKSV